MRSFWQSACATTNSRDDEFSPSSSAAALADEAAAKSKETAKKKGKRSDTCDKFVGVGFHCGQRNDEDERGRQTAVQEQNRSCRLSRSETLNALAINIVNEYG